MSVQHMHIALSESRFVNNCFIRGMDRLLLHTCMYTKNNRKIDYSYNDSNDIRTAGNGNLIIDVL